jgi:acyl-CoA synthetase (AMP-forming)/AMP-acid ligase II
MIYESPYNAGFEIPAVDITTLVLDRNLLGNVSNKPAIIDGYSGEVVHTYGSLRDKTRLFAGFLQKELGVVPGDVVAYLSFNTVRFQSSNAFAVVLIKSTDILSDHYTRPVGCWRHRFRFQSCLYA